jgi:RecB family endonuclease NucS
MGYEVKAEDTTNRGRIDMTMIGKNRIYIIEFKVDKAEEEALAQIKSRKYYEKYPVRTKDNLPSGHPFRQQPTKHQWFCVCGIGC